MKASELGEVSLKVLGIWAFIEGIALFQFPITLLQPFSSMIRDRVSPRLLILALLPSILLFALSGVLWLGSKVGFLLETQPDSPQGTSHITPEVLQSIAFSVSGIFILLGAMPFFFQFVNDALSRNAAARYPTNPMLWYHLIEFAVRLTVGIWLLSGSRSLRRFRGWLLENIKSAGHKDW